MYYMIQIIIVTFQKCNLSIITNLLRALDIKYKIGMKSQGKQKKNERIQISCNFCTCTIRYIDRHFAF